MNMRLFQFCCLLGLMTAPLWTMAGCGKEVEHTESTKTDSSGTTKEEAKTVTQNPDGSTSVEKTKTESKP